VSKVSRRRRGCTGRGWRPVLRLSTVSAVGGYFLSEVLVLRGDGRARERGTNEVSRTWGIKSLSSPGTAGEEAGKGVWLIARGQTLWLLSLAERLGRLACHVSTTLDPIIGRDAKEYRSQVSNFPRPPSQPSPSRSCYVASCTSYRIQCLSLQRINVNYFPPDPSEDYTELSMYRVEVYANQPGCHRNCAIQSFQRRPRKSWPTERHKVRYDKRSDNNYKGDNYIYTNFLIKILDKTEVNLQSKIRKIAAKNEQ